jgi:hypothetical protein
VVDILGGSTWNVPFTLRLLTVTVVRPRIRRLDRLCVGQRIRTRPRALARIDGIQGWRSVAILRRLAGHSARRDSGGASAGCTRRNIVGGLGVAVLQVRRHRRSGRQLTVGRGQLRVRSVGVDVGGCGLLGLRLLVVGGAADQRAAAPSTTTADRTAATAHNAALTRLLLLLLLLLDSVALQLTGEWRLRLCGHHLLLLCRRQQSATGQDAAALVGQGHRVGANR